MNPSNRTTQRNASDRREFLRTTTGVLGAGIAGSTVLAQKVHAAGSDVLKIGLVGSGGRGTGAAADALEADPNTRLIAVADAFADKTERSVKMLKKRFADRIDVPEERRFAGFDAYQQVIDSGVDVVLLATPPHFRPLHLEACVEAGKHVFTEKPMAVDAPGVRRVLAACEQAKQKGLSIESGFMYRHDPGMCETVRRVHDGAVGRVVAIEATYNVGPPWFRNRQRQPDWTEMQYQMQNWYPFTWLSGDHNVEQHVHSLDKALWILNDEPPVRAWGSGGRQIRFGDAIGHIFDHHCVTYEYDDGRRVYSHCRRQAGCHNEISDLILGSQGTAELMKKRIEGEKPWRYRGPAGQRYVEEHRVLFKAIRDGQPVNDGKAMAQSTLMAILGRMVTYTGQAVTWEQAMNSQEDLSPDRYAWDATPPIVPDENGDYPIAMPGFTQFK
jgi:predicted dehydrogenase